MEKFLKLSIVLVILMTLVGCGPKAPAKGDDAELLTKLESQTEVVIWHTLSEYHATGLQGLADEFNASQDMVKVVLQAQPYADFESKVMQAVRNGVGPDMIFTFPTVAANYISDDLIVDLAPYVNHEEIGIPGYKDMMLPAIYEESSQWDGKLFLMPIMKTGEVLYYNKTIYDQLGLTAPATWTELEENSRKITAETGKPAFGFDAVIDGVQLLALQAGSDYINVDTNTFALNNDIAVAELDAFGKLVQEGVYRLVGEDQYFSNPFGAGAVASYIGSSAGYGFVNSAVDGKFEMATAPVPQEGPEKYVNSWGSSVLVFKTTPEKALASYTFAKWFTEPTINTRWSIIFGAVPVMLDAQNSPEFVNYSKENPVIATLIESLKNVGYLPAVPGSAAVRTSIGKAAEEVSLGLKDAKTALTDAEAEANASLSAN